MSFNLSQLQNPYRKAAALKHLLFRFGLVSKKKTKTKTPNLIFIWLNLVSAPQ